jgi:anti-anti-sigma regulatory factor
MVEMQSITLPPVMDITTVQLWHDNLTIYANKPMDIRMDASAVEKISSAGIQLMVSLEKNIIQNQSHLIVEQQSSAFTEAFRDFGLLELLQKWSKEV